MIMSLIMRNKPFYTVRQYLYLFELKKGDILKNSSCSTIEKLQEFEVGRVK